MTPLQQVQLLDKYARWSPEWGRRETWEETVARVVGWFRRKPSLAAIPTHTWEALQAAMFHMEVLPSMRIVQMAGPALDRCHVGAYNCAYLTIDSIDSFAELLYILMQGTGVGFSVEAQYVAQLPVIKHQHMVAISPWVVDDTTEGWCNALWHGMKLWFEGGDIDFDYSQIRPFGAPLATKGGRASGPEPLKQLLKTVRLKILSRQGVKLSTLDCHDIACLCGSIVQVGGVRRAAEISLSDFNDHQMRDAKQGNFWLVRPERAMANNSAVYTTKPGMVDFMQEWTALASSGTGERGIFNREAATKGVPMRRSPYAQFGTNPCGEIVLRPMEFCNLSIAVARPADTREDLLRKVRLAAVWGTMQSTLTHFTYLRDEWRVNCDSERLLGVDITGIQDCPLLSYPDADQPSEGRRELFSALRVAAIEENKKVAALLGINPSVAVTCIKPSGNSSQLLDCSSGLHPRYAAFYIRRLRLGAGSPIAALLRSAGVPHNPEVGQDPVNPTVWVFDFPVKSPPGAMTRHAMTALDQLTNWLDIKECYTEHNPSCTIYVAPDEWLEVGAWVWRNWDKIGGIAFLPKDGGIYELAPYEEVTQEEYQRLADAFPVIDFDRLLEFEVADNTEINREFACTGDKCEL